MFAAIGKYFLWQKRVNLKKAFAMTMVINDYPSYSLEVILGREMTKEELFNFCVANKHLRVERDEQTQIIVMPPPRGDTGRKHIKIASALDQWNTKYGLGEAFESVTGFDLPDGSMRNPDAAWITAEKWNGLSEEEKDRFLPFAPDFVVEVLSPSDDLKTAQQKMIKWVRNGTRLGWLIAPKQKLTFIYRADGTVDKVEGFDKVLSGEDVLPGFEFDLSVLL